MYRPTPVASSVRARASRPTRSGGPPGAVSSGVGIDPGLLGEGLHDLPGGEPFEVIGPEGFDPFASGRDVRPASHREHEPAGPPGGVERRTTLTRYGKAG